MLKFITMLFIIIINCISILNYFAVAIFSNEDDFVEEKLKALDEVKVYLGGIQRQIHTDHTLVKDMFVFNYTIPKKYARKFIPQSTTKIVTTTTKQTKRTSKSKAAKARRGGPARNKDGSRYFRATTTKTKTKPKNARTTKSKNKRTPKPNARTRRGAKPTTKRGPKTQRRTTRTTKPSIKMTTTSYIPTTSQFIVSNLLHDDAIARTIVLDAIVNTDDAIVNTDGFIVNVTQTVPRGDPISISVEESLWRTTGTDLEDLEIWDLSSLATKTTEIELSSAPVKFIARILPSSTKAKTTPLVKVKTTPRVKAKPTPRVKAKPTKGRTTTRVTADIPVTQPQFVPEMAAFYKDVLGPDFEFEQESPLEEAEETPEPVRRDSPTYSPPPKPEYDETTFELATEPVEPTWKPMLRQAIRPIVSKMIPPSTVITTGNDFVNASTLKSTSFQPSDLRSEIYNEMLNRNAGYFSTGLRKLCLLIAEKESKYTQEVLSHMKVIKDKMDLELDEPMASGIQTSMINVLNAKMDKVKTVAAELAEAIINRHHLSPMENDFFVSSDRILSHNQGVIIADALADFKDFPQGGLKSYDVCEALMKAFLMPLSKPNQLNPQNLRRRNYIERVNEEFGL